MLLSAAHRLWGLPAVPMLKQFFRSRAAVLLVLIPVMLAPVAASQSVDDVHSIPRIDLEEAMPSGIKLSDSVLRHAKPLRADVDVVLVPVTVTDPMNRPVLGLQKQDDSLGQWRVTGTSTTSTSARSGFA